jgi:ABC-type glycerol-3-phosphate transport system substrate-binding protein
MKHVAMLLATAAIALGLAGCGEKPQTASHAKAVAPAFSGPSTAFTAAGWKPGEEASWKEQLRTRAQQGQDEYSRAAAP